MSIVHGKGVRLSRVRELDWVLNCVAGAECCAVVGLSNVGKSVFLRSVEAAAAAGLGGIRAEDHIFIYIDFNLMVEMTEQAFYELILRSACAVLSGSDDRPLRERVEAAYRKVVDSSNPFLIPLGFNEGIMALCEGLGRRVAFLFDEFDEPFAQIDQRVFLNLRALRDRYDRQLCYVVATGRRLDEMRRGNEIGEFCELFAPQTAHLLPLTREEMQQAAIDLMAQDKVVPTDDELAFVWQMTGGHPGLMEAVCAVLIAASGLEEDQGYGLVREKLDSDLNVRGECVKLWNGLVAEQKEALMDFVGGRGVERARLAPLLRSGVLRENGDLDVFGALFAGFVRRQRLAKSPYPEGVRIDVDSGEVWVDGQRTTTLTDLEYRLLLLFYGRMGKICDKYQIVEAVWGAEYIDRVDDARIDKLVSRLRRKIEPDSEEPRYLHTVRGRGYRLVEA